MRSEPTQDAVLSHFTSFAGRTGNTTTASARVRPAVARALCAGHFPGDPLLPGAALLALMAELGATLGNTRARLVAVERSVFRRRVGPDSDLIVGARRRRAADGGFGVHATVSSEHQLAAWALLRFEGSK
jgi:3-hydroxymyristoyl/3-hydroxydecanoyl-(acyl carrier protein) dehydratase